MKTLFFSFFIALLFSLSFREVSPAPNDPVTIPDASLRAAIEQKLGKSSGDTITEAEMASITDFLTVTGVVNDLTGLEHATGVPSIQVFNSRNTLTDLSPLQNLTQLERLALFHTGGVTDISPLGNLTNMTELTIQRLNPRASAGISDLTPLSNLTALKILFLSGNAIEDLSPLSGLTALTNLTLAANKIVDISPLSGLTALKQLYLQSSSRYVSNDITDVSPLRSLTNLEELDLGLNRKLSDISPLAALTNLRHLAISSIAIDESDLQGVLPFLVSLRYLDIKGNSISDLSVLERLPRGTPLASLDVRQMRLGVNVGWMLADLTPLVRFVKAGRLVQDNTIPSSPQLNLQWNFRLDYASIYEDLPALIDEIGSGSSSVPGVLYSRSTPVLERKSAGALQEESPGVYRGRPGARYKLEVQAVNQIPVGSQTARNRWFGGAPVTWTITAPDGTTTTRGTLTEGGLISTSGSASIIITLGDSGEMTTVAAVVSENRPRPGEIEHDELRVTFTITADNSIEIPPDPDPEAPEDRPLEPPVLDPSSVAMDRVVFNEIYNATDDTNDWLEIKNVGDTPVSLKDWEISIVTEHTPGNPHRADVDIVTFPDYILPSGGILLITNIPPSETDLIPGQDITKTDNKPAVLPQYFVAPELQLPAHRYLLILRSETDQNGKPEAFEDVAGTYLHQNFHEIVETESGRVRVYATHVWPLQVSNPGHVAALTGNVAWQRVSVSRRGYEPKAWAETGYQKGIGYKPQASRETSLGTPGYPNPIVVGSVLQASAEVGTPVSSGAGQSPDVSTTGRVSFSELMFASQGGLHSLPQWMELYNNSGSERVNLKGWTLAIEVRDTDGTHRSGQMKLHELSILPKQTALVVTWGGRNSGHFPEARVYHLWRHNDKFEQDVNRNRVLSASGFSLRLLDTDGRLVDAAGNLDGDRQTMDAPTWDLPAGRTASGIRTSIVRRFRDRVPVDGKHPMSWRRAADTALAVKTYWGNKTDLGSPGYRKGGILPVGLSSFLSERTETGEVVITWTTASETRNAGFNVLRSRTSQGSFVRINTSLISGAGTTSERQTYTYQDRDAAVEVAYYYRLEEVSLSGERQRLATVRLKGHVSAGGKHLRQWGALKVLEW